MNLSIMNLSDLQCSVAERTVVSIFVIVSCMLFVHLDGIQPNYYIDEAFHIPQTQRYCEGKFHEWDDKITTLPGLYLIAVGLLAPFHLCTTKNLRTLNLLGTFSNFYVIYKILEALSIISRHKNGAKDIDRPHKRLRTLLASLNIVLLPPLYFWSFFFYTDVLSTNLVLLMLLLHLRKSFKASIFVGFLAVFLRQTNIIWVAMTCLERLADFLENSGTRRNFHHSKTSPAHIGFLWKNVIEELRSDTRYWFLANLACILLPYAVVGLGFIVFAAWNGGIVLGDRNAHVATIHLPQMFYYAVFTAGFAWPFTVPYVRGFINLIIHRPKCVAAAIIVVSFLVYSNTLVHPYVLADNRHYTFYLWNRLLGPRLIVRFGLVPIYVFCMYANWRCLNHLRFTSQVGYYVCVVVVLVPQLLLEPRYFFIPYLIFRLNLREPKCWQLAAECITVLAVNVFQFSVFVNKIFYWDDDPNPQRISW